MQEGATPLKGDTKEEFEVWVWQVQPPGSGLRMDWSVLMSGISTIEDARKYRDFLINNRQYDRTQVMMKRIVWTVTEIEMVS